MRDHIQGFKEEARKRRLLGGESFFPWFHWLQSTQQAFDFGEGIWNRSFKFLASQFLGNLHECIGFEIGSGGGSNVAAACKDMQFVYGLDVHEEQDFVTEELQRRGIKNFSLITGNGRTFSVRKKVDLIYSYCVFGHMNGIEEVQEYIYAISQALSPPGIAIIYFNRLVRSKYAQTEQQWLADMETEKLNSVGYRSREVRPNQLSLFVSMWKMEKICNSARLLVLRKDASHRIVDGKKLIAGQHCVVLGISNWR